MWYYRVMNYKVLFVLLSVFVLSLSYLFSLFAIDYIFPEVVTGIWFNIASVVLSVLPFLTPALIVFVLLMGLSVKDLETLIDDRKNPFGVMLRYFGIYLVLVFPINFLIMLIWGENQGILFTVNSILILPTSLIGFIRGLMAIKKSA